MYKIYNKKVKYVRSNPNLCLLRHGTLVLIIHITTNFAVTLSELHLQSLGDLLKVWKDHLAFRVLGNWFQM